MDKNVRALRLLCEDASYIDLFLDILDKEISLPNIPMKTMGGKVWWTDIVSYNGWRLQQNRFTHHARILDNRDTRIAWGTINGMQRALDRLVAGAHAYEENPSDTSNRRQYAMADLRSLKELLDTGAITQEEYESKKKTLLEQI